MRRKGAALNRHEALKHAVKAHAGQIDKCGQPYILHPIAVAEVLEVAHHLAFGVSGALLHDVREDTSYSLPGLSAAFDRELDAITRRSGEPYAEYIERCSGHWVASQVKLADL